MNKYLLIGVVAVVVIAALYFMFSSPINTGAAVSNLPTMVGGC